MDPSYGEDCVSDWLVAKVILCSFLRVWLFASTVMGCLILDMDPEAEREYLQLICWHVGISIWLHQIDHCLTWISVAHIFIALSPLCKLSLTWQLGDSPGYSADVRLTPGVHLRLRLVSGKFFFEYPQLSWCLCFSLALDKVSYTWPVPEMTRKGRARNYKDHFFSTLCFLKHRSLVNHNNKAA